MSALLRLAIRYISRRTLQSALFALGVALGVAVIVAIDIASDSAGRAFQLSSESVAGKATHQIVGGPNGLPSTLYTRLRLELGIGNSAPVVSEFARVDGSDERLRLLGVDPFAEPPFRSYLAGGESGADAEALNQFIATPGSIVISEGLAGRLGYGLGDSLRISAAGSFHAATVVGILSAADAASQQALDDLIISDIATAQEWLGMAGRLSRIDLILDADEASRLAAQLPLGTSLIKSGADDALAQLLSAFEFNLQALSLLALLVGLFLIYNTVTFSVVQRRGVIGITRSLGMTRSQVFAFVLGEALILGAIGAALGLALGILFGRGAVRLVAQTINDVYFALNVGGVSIDSFTLFKGAAVGLLASLGAAFLPSLEATRTPPAGIMKRSSGEEGARRLLPWLSLAAALMVAFGLLLLQAPGDDLYLGFAALMLILVGGACFTPLVMLLLMRLLIVPCGWIFGALGRMACRALIRSLSRTSVAVAALTVAVSVSVGLGAMIGSFRDTVADWLANSLGAQIFISPPLFANNNASVDVDPAALEIIRAMPGVDRVSAARAVTVMAPAYPDLPPVNVLASSFDIAGEKRRFRWTQAQPGDHQATLDAGKVMVSESFAWRRAIDELNNHITLVTDRGERDFEIFGVYYDYSTDQGTLYMARSVYDRYFDDPFITSLAAFVADEAATDSLVREMRTRLADYDLLVQDNAGLQRGALEVFDRTFTITIALRLLTTLVAFIGILSALMALQLEQSREYGAMRAIGMTSGQLRRYTLLQTGLMGAVAGALALPIGTVISLVMIYVINVRSFGWTMDFAILPGEYVEAFLAAVIAALLAGVYPAYRLGRLEVAEALRGE